MAKFEPKFPNDFLAELSRLGSKTDEITEKVLQAGAEVVYEEINNRLDSVIGSETKVKSRSTGELKNALGISPVKLSNDGKLNIKIGLREPRSRQYAAKGKRSYKTITNAMIANVIEYGKHGQAPKPIIKPAWRAAKKRCEEVMIKTFDDEVGKL